MARHQPNLRRGVQFIVLAAVAWAAALAVAGLLSEDRTLVTKVMASGWQVGALTIGTFAANHAIRFLRWQWMLNSLGARVPWLASLAIFMAGLGLLPTPGKAGVAARSVLLERFEVPVGTSLAAYFAERVFDLLGLVILATLFYRGPFDDRSVVLGAAVLICVAYVIRHPSVILSVLRRLTGKSGRMSAAIDGVARLLDAAGCLFGSRRAIVFVLLGLIANVMVGLLVWSIMIALGGANPGFAAVGAVAIAHLAGSASMTPGGMGPFEIALLLDLRHLGAAEDVALIAVACTRFVTLWGAVIVGLPLLLARLRVREEATARSPYRAQE